MPPSARLQRLFPFLAWPRPDAQLLRSEALAGLAVGLMVIPQGVAYAALAGMPLIAGIYAALLPALIAVLFSASPRLAVGPTARLPLVGRTAWALGHAPSLERLQAAAAALPPSCLVVGVAHRAFARVDRGCQGGRQFVGLPGAGGALPPHRPAHRRHPGCAAGPRAGGRGC